MTDIGRITFPASVIIPYLSREISRLISQASNEAAGSKLTCANSGPFLTCHSVHNIVVSGHVNTSLNA